MALDLSLLEEVAILLLLGETSCSPAAAAAAAAGPSIAIGLVIEGELRLSISSIRSFHNPPPELLPLLSLDMGDEKIGSQSKLTLRLRGFLGVSFGVVVMLLLSSGKRRCDAQLVGFTAR